MTRTRPRVLLAAPAPVLWELASVLEDEVEVLAAQVLEEALRHHDAAEPRLVVVAYGFDEARPYSLLHHVRGRRAREHVPVILVCAQAVALGAPDADIRDSYARLGADEFINVAAEAARVGREAALRRVRRAVLRRLGVTSERW